MLKSPILSIRKTRECAEKQGEKKCEECTMNKTDQIISITSAIKDLCGLIYVIETNEGYTPEQAAKYYDEIFKMHKLK